ncbi:hypothetical protein OG21DRAFT_1485806 [Imleria badia]|nr:hypothetical protein OG21DRAFT_1485806 [Imleria badia]
MLREDTSNGSDVAQITIEFALAQSSADAVNEALKELGLNTTGTPSAAVLVHSAVGTSTNVATKVQTFETTWRDLLRGIERFIEIVTGIAQVFGAQCLSIFTVTARSNAA